MSDAEPGGVLRSTGLPAGPRTHVFEGIRPVRLGDADQHGRLRLDSLARHLQDLATDDSVDSGMNQEPVVWLVRRAAITIERWPRYLERLSYATFCTGSGPRWAERRTSGRGSAGGRLEAAVLWAAVDSVSGRPAQLSDLFHRIWGAGSGARPVSARLLHPAPPPVAEGRRWAIRTTDLDVMGHVNNAVHWEAVEDELARRLPGRIPVAAECEYRIPLDLGTHVRVVSEVDAGSLRIWLVSDGGVHASALVSTDPAD
ncbi:MAG: acyl-[acyl-carrier-protein] thioesterase [Candidatus Dormibacteria bacterium]